MKRNEILILSLLLLFYFLWFALPVSLVGAKDFRMVDAFNVDEAESLQRLAGEVKKHGFNLPFYSYGHLYYNSGLLPLVLVDLLFPVSEQAIVILFRLLSALFFAGTILVVFLTGKRFFGNITAWLSVILLLTISAQLYVYSAMLHPDTAQLFFISLGIFFCCKYFDLNSGRKWKYLAYAAGAAGLAFSTKYAGIMLMPIIIGIDFLEKPEKEKTPLLKLFTTFFFCTAAAILLHKNWIIRYISFNENSEGFFQLVSLGRILSIIVGVLLLITAVFRKKISQNIYSQWISEKAINIILFAAIFLIAFSISSPGCVRGLNFINGFIAVTDAARYGHWFNESLGFGGWIRVLLSKGILNYPVFILFIAEILFLIRFGFKKENKKIIPSLILISWILIYFITLVMRINADFAHYLLPILPFIIILAAFTIELIVKYFSKKTAMINSNILAFVIPLFFFGYNTYFSFTEIFNDREALVNKVKNSDGVKGGEWLEENYPPETKILYDRYAYIPGKFYSCVSSWGITQKQISETNPEIIVVNAQIYGRFIDPDKAASFLGGSNDYLEKHFTYKLLLDGNSEYKLLKDFGKIKIFSIN